MSAVGPDPFDVRLPRIPKQMPLTVHDGLISRIGALDECCDMGIRRTAQKCCRVFAPIAVAVARIDGQGGEPPCLENVEVAKLPASGRIERSRRVILEREHETSQQSDHHNEGLHFEQRFAGEVFIGSKRPFAQRGPADHQRGTDRNRQCSAALPPNQGCDDEKRKWQIRERGPQ